VWCIVEVGPLHIRAGEHSKWYQTDRSTCVPWYSGCALTAYGGFHADYLLECAPVSGRHEGVCM